MGMTAFSLTFVQQDNDGPATAIKSVDCMFNVPRIGNNIGNFTSKNTDRIFPSIELFQVSYIPHSKLSIFDIVIKRTINCDPNLLFISLLESVSTSDREIQTHADSSISKLSLHSGHIGGGSFHFLLFVGGIEQLQETLQKGRQWPFG